MEDEKKKNEFNSIKSTVLWAVGIIIVGQIVLIIVYNNCFEEVSDISVLNSFYSTIFAIVALVAAIAGFLGWQRMKELRNSLETFNKNEDKINFLHRTKDLSDWVMDIFKKDNNKKSISSSKLPITGPEDIKKYKEIEKHIIETTTQDSWLKIVYAKKLMELAEEKREKLKQFYSDEHGCQKMEVLFTRIIDLYKRVVKIFEFIEKRDLLEKEDAIYHSNCDLDIETVLHNLHGKVYWEIYNNEKFYYLAKLRKENKVEDELNIWTKWWKNEQQREKLLNSINHYEKALKITDNIDDDADETLGNLAVVLIELSKFSLKTDLSYDPLVQAKKLLNQVTTKTFNTHWDHARAIYYLQKEEKKGEESIGELLDLAIGDINSKDDKDFFIEKITKELQERIGEKNGFPGSEEKVKELVIQLGKKVFPIS